MMSSFLTEITKHKKHKNQVKYKKKHKTHMDFAKLLIDKLAKVKTRQEEILQNFLNGDALFLIKKLRKPLPRYMSISGIYIYENTHDESGRQIRELRNIRDYHKKEKMITYFVDTPLACLAAVYLRNNSFLKNNHSKYNIIQCGDFKCSLKETINEICDEPFMFQVSPREALFVTSDGLFVLYVSFHILHNGCYDFYIQLYNNNSTFDCLMGIYSSYSGVISNDEKINFILNRNNILIIEGSKLFIKYNMANISPHIKFASIIMSGMGQPGMGQPGMGQPGIFNKFLTKGLYDPRILLLIQAYAFEEFHVK